MSDGTPQESMIARSWTHAHEEDHDGLLVFRSSDQDFPPAHGRQSFDLQPGGTLARSGPGPDDRTVRSTGTWSVEGDQLELHPGEGAAQRYRVAAIEADRLVVQPLDP